MRESGLEATGYPPGLVAYLKGQGQSTDAAKEIAQEAVVRYLNARNRDRIASPVHYIFRIALRQLKRFRRDRARARSLDADPAIQQTVFGPEDQCILREQLERMYEAIPPRYRQVLWLHKVEGKSSEEIAKELNITPESVFVYLSRALSYAYKSQADGVGKAS